MASEEIENVSSWLYRVARNLIIDCSRKKTEERMPYALQEEDLSLVPLSEILLVENNTPETVLAQQIIEEELSAAIARLPQEQRVIYELNEQQGIPFKEIADATGIPINTLISRKKYAMDSIRRQLKYLQE